ncbi:MAG: hypothetical protein HC884_03830 [Chloroflexaceae bacterium]|nr:hypothetical protein [Chloroflexaceae bacterium]
MENFSDEVIEPDTSTIRLRQALAAEQDDFSLPWHQENLQRAEERCLGAVRKAMGG